MGKNLDLVTFLNVMLVPIFYWHTGISVVEQSYFHRHNLVLHAPVSLWPALHLLHWAINMLFLAKVLFHILFEKKDEIGILLFITSLWIWFYFGLVWASDPVFFTSVLVVTHGLSYHIHVTSYRPERRKTIQHLSKYALVMIGLALLWRYSWAYFGKREDYLIPLLWAPLITHYAFDALIWRRQTETA